MGNENDKRSITAVTMRYNIIHRITVLNMMNVQPLTPELNMVVLAHVEHQN